MSQVRDVQVVCKVHVTGRPRHQRETARDKHGWHDGQAVQTIGQVDGVAGADDHKVSQQNVEQPQLRHHVFEERHHQLGGRGVFSCQVKREGHAQRNHRHPEILPTGDQPFSVFAHDFAVVINKTDDPVANQHGQHAPDIGVRRIGPQQNGHHNRGQDHDPAHGRRTALAEVRFRTIVAYNLAEREFLQTGNHARAHPQRDEQRSQQADDGAKRQIGKDVKA